MRGRSPEIAVMSIVILDYGVGNLHSLEKAVARTGASVTISDKISVAVAADALILPGVGAFASASEFIAPHRDALRAALDTGLPCLGICLGMQLLFDSSEEGEGRGIGVIPGRVRRIAARRVPQIGWNDIEDAADPLFQQSGLTTAYFANGFVCEPRDQALITAWTTHESDRFTAAVRSRNIRGVQFHPEKSSTPGLAFIDAFLKGIGS